MFWFIYEIYLGTNLIFFYIGYDILKHGTFKVGKCIYICKWTGDHFILRKTYFKTYTIRECFFFIFFFFYKSIYFNYCTEGRDGSVWHYNHGAVDWSMGSRQPQQTHRRIQAWVGGKYSLPVASLHRRLCDNLRVTPCTLYCM